MIWRKINLSIVLLFCYNLLNAQTLITVGAQNPSVKKISDSLELPGTVLANESVKITSVVSEKIKKIFFDEGKFVKKNQLLVELLDNEEQAILIQVKAEYEEAQLNYERALKLSKKGNISQSILDNRLMIKKRLLGKISEIEAKIEDLKIRAPFNGITGIRNYSEGSFIKPGDIVTEIHDVKLLKIQAFIPEKYINKIESNKNFIVNTETQDVLKISGKISVVEPVIDKSTRTFKILGQIKNINNKIKPGMMVNIKIPLLTRNALLIRENALINQDDITYVYLIKEDNTVFKNQIEVGIRKNGMVEVLNGLSTNNLVVYEGINKIKEGSVVKIK